MVLTSTHSLCFEQKYEKYLSFLSENFLFLEVQFSIYLNRHVFRNVMTSRDPYLVVSLKVVLSWNQSLVVSLEVVSSRD